MSSIHAMIALMVFSFAMVYAGFYYQQERNSQPIPVFVIEGVYDGK